MLDETTKNQIRLILRSKLILDEWRKCSDSIWPLYDSVIPELIEKNIEEKTVRLSEEGKIVAKWLT